MAEIRVKGTGTIKLFESDNTSSVTIASPASLSADKTITLPDADVTLVSGTMNDATALSGTVPVGSGGTGAATFAAAGLANTPAFLATTSASQTGLTDNTATKRLFASEIFDTDSAYDTGTSKFTVPVGAAGKYCIIASLNLEAHTVDTAGTIELAIYLNGATTRNTMLIGAANPCSRFDMNISLMADLSEADYLEVYGRIDTTNSGTWHMYTGSGQNAFGAYKLIGV